MSLIMVEDFDINGPGATVQLGSRWYSNHPVPYGATGRRSTYALYSAYGLPNYYAMYTLEAEQTDAVLGFALNPGVLPWATATGCFLAIESSAGGVQFVVDVTTAGRIRVKTASAGSVLAESSDGALSDTLGYQYFEIKFTCDGTDTVQVRINGSDAIASTGGLNLRQSGAGGFGRFKWGVCFSGVNAYIDDLYILNSADSPVGTIFTDFLGDFKVHSHLFTGDGSTLQWTSTKASHYDAINDVGTGYYGYNVEYINSDTVGECDEFSITPGDMTTIRAVVIKFAGRNPGGGTAKTKPYVLIDGTKYYGDEITLPGDSSDFYTYTWELNPDTGVAWTKADLQPANAKFGFESTVLS